jgi:hypothetical protein
MTIPSNGVSVAVFNGTSTPGLATTAMRRIQDAGYVVSDNPHVAPRPVRRTAVYYRKGARREAKRVAGLLFGGAQVLPMPADVDSVSESEIVVFLGSDYEP